MAPPPRRALANNFEGGLANNFEGGLANNFEGGKASIQLRTQPTRRA